MDKNARLRAMLECLLGQRDTHFGFNSADPSASNEAAHAWSGGCNHVLDKLSEMLDETQPS